jgi:hypothetical protein
VLLALAAVAAATSVASAISRHPGVSVFAAVIGGSLAFFAALGATRRFVPRLGLVCGLVDVAVVGYWIYAPVDALRTSS